MDDLNHWLKQFEALRLECDGMTRVISTLLQREDIEHEICIGRLDVAGVGAIPMHYWICFPDGQICDLRARMWLRDSPEAPHGLFMPSAHQTYTESLRHLPQWALLDSFVFMIVAEKPIDAFARTDSPAPRSTGPAF
jgi:hypothetical protein